MAQRKNTMEDFWKRVDKGAYCWEWKGWRQPEGYGRFSYEGKIQSSHRVAWQLVNGPIPHGMYILHQCDNPPCCNPTHLFLGTHHDNVRDAWQKGRMQAPPPYTGEHHPRARLTWSLVHTMRTLRTNGATIRAIAARVGMSYTATYNVVTGKTWKAQPMPKEQPYTPTSTVCRTCGEGGHQSAGQCVLCATRPSTAGK